MKRKYTREQLEFYFVKLMNKLGRIPTEKDMSSAKSLPSVSAYAERFGSWSKIKNKLGKKELNKKKCAYCGKPTDFKKKTKKFCSANCSKKAILKEKYKKIPSKKCTVCGKEFGILDTPNFKKRKICKNLSCKTKFKLSLDAKKYNKLTPGIKKSLIKLNNNKCYYCDFKEILFFITPGRHNDKKLVNMVKKKDFKYLIVCPNHKALIETKKLKI